DRCDPVVDFDPASIRSDHRETDGRLLEGAAKAPFRFAELPLGLMTERGCTFDGGGRPADECGEDQNERRDEQQHTELMSERISALESNHHPAEEKRDRDRCW